jgi:hypothetical protein
LFIFRFVPFFLKKNIIFLFLGTIEIALPRFPAHFLKNKSSITSRRMMKKANIPLVSRREKKRLLYNRSEKKN